MNRKDAGFSLVELVIVIAIVSILLSIGLPAFHEVMARQRISSTLYQLTSDMAMARSTAVMRHEPIVVCPLGSGGGCGADKDWSTGWMIFRDPDGNREPDGQTQVLRVTDPPGGGQLVLSATRPHLRYQPDGRSAHSNLTVRVCADGRLSGKVVVNNLGRVRSERPAQSTCPKG